MQSLPTSLRPAVCVLALALLAGVTQTRASWTPPAAMQSGSSDDDTDDGMVTITATTPTSGATSSSSGGSVTINSAISSGSISYASAGTLTLGASNFYAGSTFNAIGNSIVNVGNLTLGNTGSLALGNANTLYVGSTSAANNTVTLARGSTVTLDGSVLTLVNGGTYLPGTYTVTLNGSTLAVNGTVVSLTNGNQLTLAQGETLAFGDGTLKSADGGAPASSTITSDTGLSGSLSDLSIEPNANDTLLHVKGLVTLLNSSATPLKNVTATVYLSADNLLSADDVQILTLSLSDYVDKGKIGKGKTLSLPLKRKVPSVYATYLEGKYLIVVLNADNLGSLASTPIVIGPLSAP